MVDDDVGYGGDCCVDCVSLASCLPVLYFTRRGSLLPTMRERRRVEITKIIKGNNI